MDINNTKMLQPLLGSVNCERVLLFLLARKEGYPREIAGFYQTALDPVNKQLKKLEAGGVLYSRAVGRTRLFAFNPRYPFLPELKRLLAKALAFYPREVQEALTMVRKRPRRAGKPL